MSEEEATALDDIELPEAEPEAEVAPEPEPETSTVQLAVLKPHLVSAWRASDGTKFDRVGTPVPASNAESYRNEARGHDVLLSEVQ